MKYGRPAPARIDPEVAELARVHEYDPEAIIPIFRAMQARRGTLTKESITEVARALRIPAERAFGIASFYTLLATAAPPVRTVRLCDGAPCEAAGSKAARATILAGAAIADWHVERNSCLGLCDRAPAALISDEPCGPLTPERAADALRGWRGEHARYADPVPGEMRVMMARFGRINPNSIDSAVGAGAYGALKQAIQSPPTAIVDAVLASGLQGRGGAGFLTGRKWQMVAEAKAPKKYVVCNLDESEPGSFKDRILAENDPHLLLEGLILAAYAVGANEAYIYVRGEYEWVTSRLELAMGQATRLGLRDGKLKGTDFPFTMHVHRGSGAYVCGEETALLESLEGKRGEPRVRPPYPTVDGYRGCPTVVNNVETLCAVPAILLRGPEWYRSLGTANSPGTKMFTICGPVNRPGAFEAPFGITLRQAIEQFGGGLRAGSKFKAALTGGAAGTFVPESLLDVPLDFASHKQGVALGSGAIWVVDQNTSIPLALRWLLGFFEAESCGKCTPCREGTREARIILDRFIAGPRRARDIDDLQRLSQLMGRASFCGLGQSVASPIDTALKHFGAEFTDVPY